jgi:hypothetical protein
MNGYEIWTRVTHVPDADDCFWTLRPIKGHATNWPNPERIARLATFQLPAEVRRGDRVKVRREGTPGYGAWRAVGWRRVVRAYRRRA